MTSKTTRYAAVFPLGTAAAAPAIDRFEPALEPTRQLRIMTFNIRHGKGMDGFVSLNQIEAEIRKAKAEIVALQEVDRFHLRSGVRDQVSILAHRLDMHAAFSPSLRLGPIQYGNAILSRYPIIDHEAILLPGMLERRSCLVARILINGQKLTVLNTHLGLSGREKDRQLHKLRSILDQAEQPAVLMGDFNMRPADPRLKGIRDDWTKAKLRHKHATVRFGGGEIDHIFTRISGVRTEAWVQPTDASDHHPVVADLAW